jgi:hypothetical protein
LHNGTGFKNTISRENSAGKLFVAESENLQEIWSQIFIQQSAMSVKKLTLNMSGMEEAFFSDTVLIGLVSRLPAHRICWMLNRRFGLCFRRQADLDICVPDQEGAECYFPMYEYTVPLSDERHLLYRLKTRGEFLVPELKQLDFLWMIQSSDAADAAEELTPFLREQEDIQLAQILSADRLKHLNYLLV